MEITPDELTKVRSAYNVISAVNRPERPSGQCEYVPYDFVTALKSPFFLIKTHSEAEIISHFKGFVVGDELSVTEDLLYNYVSIALSVKNPLDNTKSLFGGLPFTESSLDPGYKARTPSAQNKIKIMRSGESASSIPMPIPATQNSARDDMVIEEKTEDQAMAICFAYAWATRFIVKTAGQGLPLQLNNMRETFLKLYGKSSKTLDSFNPTETWLSGIRNAFGAFPVVKTTLILYVAAAETLYKPNKPIHNLLRYLFYQSLEFVGMHAYVSMVNIMNKVPISPALVLTWLRMSGAENTVDEIANIMLKYDNGMIADGATKERLWKYARHINEGYFNRVQTSYAPDLISVLVHIEIKLGLSSQTGYNSPLNIYAISRNDTIRDIGKMKADIFISCVNAMSSKIEGSSIIDKTYAKKHGGIQVNFGGAGEIVVPSAAGTKRTREEEGGLPKKPAMAQVSVPIPP